jgi:replicative DNA helicase
MESDPAKFVPFLPTGIPELDEELGGMGPGDVLILAGRPGMGKSAVALHIAHAVAAPKAQIALEFTGEKAPTSSGIGVFISSLEMTKAEIMQRALSMRAYAKGARVPYNWIRQRKLTPKDQTAVFDALIENSRLPILIDDKPGQTVGQIGVRLRRAQSRFKRDGVSLGLGIIDHLQLIEGEGRSDNRVAELTRITKSLKVLAKNLNIPLLVLCQLSREVEKRDDKRPQISDLRESGSIEQDADVVILMHRPEYYLQNSEPKSGTKDMAEWEGLMTKARGKLNLQVAKNRHGAPASCTVMCSVAHNWIGAL